MNNIAFVQEHINILLNAGFKVPSSEDIIEAKINEIINKYNNYLIPLNEYELSEIRGNFEGNFDTFDIFMSDYFRKYKYINLIISLFNKLDIISVENNGVNYVQNDTVFRLNFSVGTSETLNKILLYQDSYQRIPSLAVIPRKKSYKESFLFDGMESSFSINPERYIHFKGYIALRFFAIFELVIKHNDKYKNYKLI